MCDHSSYNFCIIRVHYAAAVLKNMFVLVYVFLIAFTSFSTLCLDNVIWVDNGWSKPMCTGS